MNWGMQVFATVPEVMGTISSLLAGRKHRSAWVWAIGCDWVWVALSCKLHIWAWLPWCGVALVLHCRNWYLWRPTGRTKDAVPTQ